MKGTIFDFLTLSGKNPELAKDLAELAAKYDFEFMLPDEVSDDQLDRVAGGLSTQHQIQGQFVGGFDYSAWAARMRNAATVAARLKATMRAKAEEERAQQAASAQKEAHARLDARLHTNPGQTR